MKCPADVVTACDNKLKCNGCRWWFGNHCVCGGIPEPEPPKGGREGDEK